MTTIAITAAEQALAALDSLHEYMVGDLVVVDTSTIPGKEELRLGKIDRVTRIGYYVEIVDSGWALLCPLNEKYRLTPRS